MMIGAHIESEDWRDYIKPLKDLDGQIQFTRPHPYPLQYRYKGSGDPNDYRNSEPVEP